MLKKKIRKAVTGLPVMQPLVMQRIWCLP